MGQHKKPRNKKHQPRSANIPIMRETRNELALGLHAAVETLIHAPDTDRYNDLSLKFITLGRVVGETEFMQRAKQAMLDVVARYERVGKWGVNAQEAHDLRIASGAMDQALARIPLNKLQAAEVKTIRWCIDQGIAA